MVQMDSTVRQTPDGSRDEAVGVVMYASGIRRGDVILSGGREEPVVGDPVRTDEEIAVPVTVEGQRRTRRFRAGQPVVVLRAGSTGMVDKPAAAEPVKAKEDEPSFVAAAELRRGMVLDLNEHPDGDPAYVEVAHVEPIVDQHNDRVLVVYRGGCSNRHDREALLRLVPEAEWEACKARIREQERRAETLQLLDEYRAAVAAGLPLPWRISISGSLATPEDVRAWADHFGRPAKEKTNTSTGGTDTDFDHDFGHKYSAPVSVRHWFLGPTAKTDAGSVA